MLTDRQNNFYKELIKICNSSESLKDKERKIIQEAIDKIDTGYNFKPTIEQMMIDLRYVQAANQIKFYLTEGGLSPDVQKIYDLLVMTYGKPVDEYSKNVLALTGAKVYDENNGNQMTESIFASSFEIIHFLSWLLISAVLIITLFAFDWLKNKLGIIGISLFYILSLGFGLLGLSKKRKS